MNLKLKQERRKQVFASQKLASGRVLSLDAPQGLTPLEFVLQRLSLIPARAFSVAEVAIALLIGSIILGMAAPMITKQIKNEETQYVQIEILKKTLIPSGAVMYFDLASCPTGWTELTSKYPNAANAFIRNQSGSGRDIGNWQQNAAPNIKGTFGGINHGNNGPFTMENGVGGVRTGGYMNNYTTFDASLASKVYGRNSATEVRPDNIVLLACRKN